MATPEPTLHQRRENAAFTLFEVLLSVAISSIIAYFVFSMSQSLVNLWRQVGGDVTREVDANFALDTIAADLESALFLTGKGTSFAVTALGGPEKSRGWVLVSEGATTRLPENDFLPNQHKYGWAGSWLRFLAAAPTVNTISYQIVRRGTVSGLSEQPAYILHRSVVRQDRTTTAGYDVTAETYTGSAYEGHPGEVFKPNLASYLIENVVDFGVRLYVVDSSEDQDPYAPTGMRCVFPILSSFDPDSIPTVREYPQVVDGSFEPFQYPDAVEVFLRVIDKTGASKLLALETEGLEGETFESIVSEHGRVYSRFVMCKTNR